MKISSAVCVLILLQLVACQSASNNTQKSQSVDTLTISTSTESAKKLVPESPVHSEFDSLLNQLPTWSGDTLHLYSHLRRDGYKYQGKKLDEASIKLLREATNDESNFATEYYGLYQIVLAPHVLGLVCRVPGEYEITSIMLFVLDTEKHKITAKHELAELFGDGGYLLETQSWLFANQKESNTYKCFTWQWRSKQNTFDNARDTSRTYRNMYYLLRFNGARADTIERNTTNLTQQFKRLLVPGPGGMYALGFKK